MLLEALASTSRPSLKLTMPLKLPLKLLNKLLLKVKLSLIGKTSLKPSSTSKLEMLIILPEISSTPEPKLNKKPKKIWLKLKHNGIEIHSRAFSKRLLMMLQTSFKIMLAQELRSHMEMMIVQIMSITIITITLVTNQMLIINNLSNKSKPC